MATLQAGWQAIGTCGAERAVIGGLALSAWNHARYTRDADVLIAIDRGLVPSSRPTGADSSPFHGSGLPWLWVVVNAIRYRPTGLPDPTDLVILMSTVFLIGIAEELACRYSMHRMLGPVSPALFLLLNSLVFGLLHVWQGWLGVAVNVLVGATFDIARMRGASMWMLIVCHSLINVPDRLPHAERAAGVPCTWMALGAAALVWLVFLGPRFWRSTPEAVNEAADLDANRP